MIIGRRVLQIEIETQADYKERSKALCTLPAVASDTATVVFYLAKVNQLTLNNRP